MSLFAFLYILHALFTSAGNYFDTAVVRVLIAHIFSVSTIIYRNSKGDNISVFVGLILTLGCAITLELSIFLNYKAKLRLFLQVKQMR